MIATMFLRSLRAEWTKLTTTTALYWTTLVFFILTIGTTALTTFATKLQAHDSGLAGGFMDAKFAVTPIATFGFFTIFVQAAMVITAEYRHGLAGVTFSATPVRWVVIVAKCLIYAVYAAIMTFIALVASYYVGKLIAGKQLMGLPDFSPFHDELAKRYMWLYPMVAVTLVVLTVGVGAMVRHTAGVITIMLVWYLALENFVGALGKIGHKVVAYLPFRNLQAFVDRTDIHDSVFTHTQSLWYYLAWCVVVFVIGLVINAKRDA